MTCGFCKIPCNNNWCSTKENNMTCPLCKDAFAISSNHKCSDYIKTLTKVPSFIDKTPDEIINSILKELDKPENYELTQGSTDNFIYLPITIMNDILTELKEIKEMLKKNQLDS